MKLRNVFILVAVCLFGLLAASCKKDEGKSSNELLQLVPANSPFVVCVNAKDLVDKGGLAKFEELASFRLIKKELNTNEAKLFAKVQSLLSDTRKTGLNLDQILVFGIGNFSDLIPALAMNVNNAKQLKTTIDELVLLSDNEREVVVHSNYSSYRLDSGSIMIWNDSYALLLGISRYDEDSYEDLSVFLNVNEQNITTNEEFMKFFAQRKDISTWIPMKNFQEAEFTKQLLNLNPYVDMFKDANIELSLSFTNEKAAFIVSVWPESLVAELNEKTGILKADFDESLLSYFPENSYMLFKTSLHLDKYYELMMENLKKTLESDLLTEDEDAEHGYYNRPHYFNQSELEELITMIYNSQVSNTVKLFKGDIVFGLTGFEAGLIPMPKFAMAATTTSELAIDSIANIAYKNSLNLKKEGEGQYSISIQGIASLHLVQKGNVLYVTNDKEAVGMFTKGGYPKSLVGTELAKELKQNNTYYYINLDLDSYPASITGGARMMMGSDGYSTLKTILAAYSSFNISYDGKNSCELSVRLNSNKENSLKTIVHATDKIFEKIIGL